MPGVRVGGGVQGLCTTMGELGALELINRLRAPFFDEEFGRESAQAPGPAPRGNATLPDRSSSSSGQPTIGPRSMFAR